MNDREIRTRIRRGHILFAGNRKLKIYGALNCASGKRMNKNKRVFFSTMKEAEALGYRPCGHCMRPAYRSWIERGHYSSQTPLSFTRSGLSIANNMNNFES